MWWSLGDKGCFSFLNNEPSACKQVRVSVCVSRRTHTLWQGISTLLTSVVDLSHSYLLIQKYVYIFFTHVESHLCKHTHEGPKPTLSKFYRSWIFRVKSSVYSQLRINNLIITSCSAGQKMCNSLFLCVLPLLCTPHPPPHLPLPTIALTIHRVQHI